ncbi:hydrolase [Oceanihabitans sp. IOP_32]|uniref:hydrolase n=1 Tax=Oceanihabitans sp. IOP_32 TaxID=2529032 RepID=UPI001293B7F3|nr:hydrolase [Oceanihabitans sp. IOP_32]QFZ54450.1 hydrolase [Oceanihabitans sp. IOP_32]
MLNTENTGLILVDVQGKLARTVFESESLIANIEKLIKGCKILGIPIVWLEQYPEGLGHTVPEISKLLKNQKPIEKRFFNALDEKQIEHEIVKLNKPNWLICGIEAHVCVYQTAMGLLAKKLNVELVADCIASRKKYDREIAIKKMRDQGAHLSSLEICLFELTKDSKTEVFKKILPLIK